MMDHDVKEQFRVELQEVRQAVVWKLDGLSEYDARRPLTNTGTSLLGLVKHLAIWEARYLGEVFERPFPGSLPHWDDSDAAGTDLWVSEDEPREQIHDLWRRVAGHSEETITMLELNSPGRVPWWPRPDVRLFDVLVHLLAETNRHAGHADILREQLDGATGTGPEDVDRRAGDALFWADRRAMIERAARIAGSDGA